MAERHVPTDPARGEPADPFTAFASAEAERRRLRALQLRRGWRLHAAPSPRARETLP